MSVSLHSLNLPVLHPTAFMHHADEDLSTGSLRAGSVFEDDTARDAVAAYKAARAAPGAPAM